MSTRDRILEASAELFALHGYKDTRMTRIASAAGLSRAALYKHFQGKEAILMALNERVIEDARQVGLPLLRGPAPGGERLADWLRYSLQSSWRQHAARVVIVEETQNLLLEDEGATAAIVDEVAASLRALLREGIRSGEFKDALKPARVAKAIQSLLMGLDRNNVSNRPMFEVKSGAEIEAVIDLILGGIRK
jgi:AcrR family transcriptional regulator